MTANPDGNHMSDQVINYTACPICSGNVLIPVLHARDFTVSGDEFQLVECTSCHLRITQNVPVPGLIGQYYKSQEYISHSESKKGLVNRLYFLARRRTLSGKLK